MAFLLFFTNWLYLVPMDWLHIANRPNHTNRQMLTYPNLPLKLFLTELFSAYPDVNRNFIQFFQTQARPGDIILTTYGDLPLQFYTPFQVIGGYRVTFHHPGRLIGWYPVMRFAIIATISCKTPKNYIREKLSLAS